MKHFLYLIFIDIPNYIYDKPPSMNKYFYWFLISLGSLFDLRAIALRLYVCFKYIKALLKGE